MKERRNQPQMSILNTDLVTYYSNPLASAGNQLAQLDPNASLGGWLASTVWPGSVLNDLFDDVSGIDNLNLVNEYRCVFLVNQHGSLAWTGPVVWFSSFVSGGAQMAVGIDPTAPSPINGNIQQALIIPSTTTAPAGVVFHAPVDQSSALLLPDIPSGYGLPLWLRRSAQNTVAVPDDSFTLSFVGNSL
jgi:hypothetical protein